jgi:hypothetical protein
MPYSREGEKHVDVGHGGSKLQAINLTLAAGMTGNVFAHRFPCQSLTMRQLKPRLIGFAYYSTLRQTRA